jgi:hypothetical protein
LFENVLNWPTDYCIKAISNPELAKTKMDPARKARTRPAAKHHVSAVHNVSTNRTRGSRASNISKGSLGEESKRQGGNFTYNADRVIDNGTFGVVY